MARGRAARSAERGGAKLLVLALVLGVSALFLALQFRADPAAMRQLVASLRGSPQPAGRGEPAVRDDPSRILQCRAADGSTFYTNAPSCAAADLDNRVTELPADPPPEDAGIGEGCLDPAGPHQFLPRCAEAFRQALQLESALATASDPSRAPEAEQYCALIAEGVHAGCPADSSLFCFLRVCQQRADRLRTGGD